MSLAVGSDYERLLCDFIRLGGDILSCPFDAEGYAYEGPRIEGGEIVAESSEPSSQSRIWVG